MVWLPKIGCKVLVSYAKQQADKHEQEGYVYMVVVMLMAIGIRRKLGFVLQK